VLTVELLDGILDDKSFNFILVPSEKIAMSLSHHLGYFYYPSHDVFPFDNLKPSRRIIGQRLKVLYLLSRGDINAVVGTLRAFLTPTLEWNEYRRYLQHLDVNSSLTDEFFMKLVQCGYERVYTVRSPAQFAKRGMIVDIFDPVEMRAVRLEMGFEKMEKMRYFDPVTQRSLQSDISEVFIHPAAEWVHDEKKMEKLVELAEELGMDVGTLLDKIPSLTRGQPFFIWRDKNYKLIIVDEGKTLKTYRSFVKDVEEFCVERRLLESFMESGPNQLANFYDRAGEIVRVELKKVPRMTITVEKEEYHEAEFEEFSKGDPVVHEDFGIGIYEGTKVVETILGKREYMVIKYRDGVLYVPLDRFHKVHSYIGGQNVQLDSLALIPWRKRLKKIKKELEAEVREIAQIHATRKVIKGQSFHGVEDIEEEFVKTFPYIETKDQMTAINDVLNDLEASYPMDRLVCGDAGYGKTEVALRAAFRVVLGGGQVVVLAPTTVLARQHFQSFKERLAPFGINVEILDGRTSKIMRENIKEGLRSGRIDIVVGTHALLASDVEFANLALVVIDEEQRFGVRQKEHFKKLRMSVNVLSLSATPIPRTLHMALSGLKDLSVISTPPLGRKPVVTFVVSFNWKLVRLAILRELQRGGQVFYIKSRIKGMEEVVDMLKKLVPGASVEMVHGQMSRARVDEIMQRFRSGDLDVLVATPIVQFGIDVPNANTLILHDAHRYGISDLYQLRGRVGRSDRRAFAYLFYDPRKLSGKDSKRLEILKTLEKPGSAFKLALMDLETRGAGEIFGTKQHGRINAIGLIMYNKVLKEVMEKLKHGKLELEERALEMEGIPADLIIPSDYIMDTMERVRYYRRIATADEKQVDEIAEEMKDRFGKPPETLERLLEYARIRARLKNSGFVKVIYDEKKSRLILVHSRKVVPFGLLRSGKMVSEKAVQLDDIKRSKVLNVLARITQDAKE